MESSVAILNMAAMASYSDHGGLAVNISNTVAPILLRMIEKRRKKSINQIKKCFIIINLKINKSFTRLFTILGEADLTCCESAKGEKGWAWGGRKG